MAKRKGAARDIAHRPINSRKTLPPAKASLAGPSHSAHDAYHLPCAAALHGNHPGADRETTRLIPSPIAKRASIEIPVWRVSSFEPACSSRKPLDWGSQ